MPWTALHNLYGPTEAAIDVTAWSCPAEFDGAIVPIGRSIANTRVYLLDGHGAPVPFGAVFGPQRGAGEDPRPWRPDVEVVMRISRRGREIRAR
ncbi:AMP-binding protein [Bradyrhizobium yuanmingense]|uniref:AMP-binding protein n=1 Tax=Bradyrhizobium yuanmingense TaxID=108015 RepID=UPI003B971D02